MKQLKTLEEVKYHFGFRFNDNLQALYETYAIYIAHIEFPQMYKVVNVNSFAASKSCGRIVYDEQTTAFVSTSGDWFIATGDLASILAESTVAEIDKKGEENEDD